MVADELTQDVYGCYVLEDMGYDSDPHRMKLRANNNISVIPTFIFTYTIIGFKI